MMDDVLTELRLLDEHYEKMFGAVRGYFDVNTRNSDAVWKDIADLRDELHAVANRLENLTRALMAEPAEVAEKIVRLADADS